MGNLLKVLLDRRIGMVDVRFVCLTTRTNNIRPTPNKGHVCPLASVG
jgi:hypothetical protein